MAVTCCFTPKSGHCGARLACPLCASPLCAKSGRSVRLSSALAQGDERIEDQSIEGQALAKRTFARAKCPLRRDAYFVDAGLPRRCLDPVNQLRHQPTENIRYPEQVGPKGDEQVAVVALLLRAGPGE